MTFRRWVQERWYCHLEELESYGERTKITPDVYFNTYKWWLKRQYKSEMLGK